MPGTQYKIVIAFRVPDAFVQQHLKLVPTVRVPPRAVQPFAADYMRISIL